MNLPRRGFLGLAGIAVALPSLAGALAASYPTRPVRLLVGYAAGGPLDISARLIAQWLSDHLGQSFIVENQPGAGNNIATAAVVRAPPDGYTLLEISASNAWNSALYDHLTFDFRRDIVPIAGVRRAGGVLEVTPDFPAKTVPEFIEYAKKKSRQDQRGRCGHWERPSPIRRTVQDDGGRGFCDSELSRLGTGPA